MSEIVVRRHHDLGLARAKRLAETMALRLRDDYGGTYAWTGDHLQFERTGASGRITVKPDAVEVRVEIGFLLSPLRGRIEREIRAFCDEQFGKAGVARPRSAGATRCPERGDQVLTLPGGVQVRAAEVTVGGKRAVELSPVPLRKRAQVERLHDGRGCQIHQALDRALDLERRPSGRCRTSAPRRRAAAPRRCRS